MTNAFRRVGVTFVALSFALCSIPAPTPAGASEEDDQQRALALLQHGCGTPVAQVNSSSDEQDPFVTADGSALYFDSSRAGFLDLYVAVRRGDGSFDAPQPLTNLNTTTTDGHPRLTQDGLTLYWSSTRSDGGAQGGTDIWLATRASTAGSFGTPTRVPELSSASNESLSWIAPDGCVAYLQSDRTGTIGAQDVFVAVKPL